MIARRTIFCALALGLCLAGVAWIGATGPGGQISPRRLAEDQPYAVDVAFDRTRMDLTFDEKSRYLLIVGSLGSGHNVRTATLSSEPIKATSLMSAQLVAPLVQEQKPHKSTVASAKRSGENKTAAVKSPAVRHFHLHVTDGSLDDARHYVRVAAQLVGEGREVQVYLDRQQTEKQLSNGLVDSIVRLLDDNLLPRFRRQVGGFRDVDGDGKFTVLLSPWLDKLQGGKTSLGGFVRESDFRTDIEAPFSNRCDMMYLNSNLQPGAHLQTLLAHEFMHAVSFSARLPSKTHPAGLPDEEDWLNEAIAHLSENLNGDGWSNLDYRISRYLAQTHKYPLVVDDYYHAGLWRNHGCRGATYLFLRWCVDEFGVEVLKKLIHGPASGRENLRHATGIEFDELFRRWTIALYQSNREIAADLSAEPGEQSECEFDEYRSLDLRGRIGNWGLAGPRTVEWTVGDASLEFSLTGTSVAYILLNSASSAGCHRINLSGQFGTQLQVTLIKLPSDAPIIEPTSSWETRTGSETTSHRLQVGLATTRGIGIEVEHVSFCKNEGEVKQTICFAGQRLHDCRMEAVETQNRACFEFPLPSTPGNWLATVAGHDKTGRRATTFIDIPAAKTSSLTRLAAGQRPERTATKR